MRSAKNTQQRDTMGFSVKDSVGEEEASMEEKRVESCWIMRRCKNVKLRRNLQTFIFGRMKLLCVFSLLDFRIFLAWASLCPKTTNQNRLALEMATEA